MMLTERGDGSSMVHFLNSIDAHGLTAEMKVVDEKYTHDLDQEFVARLRLYHISLR
jgi:hypothetical protein